MPGTGCCGIEYGCVVEWGVTKLVEYDDFLGMCDINCTPCQGHFELV